jgi:hypothetical protein
MTPSLPPPFYLDWTFWTAALAFLAIVLSQLSPIHLLVRPRKLEVEVHSRIFITHHVGNPNMALVVGIRNTGGRELRVRGLSIDLSRDGKSVGTYPAQNFFETASSQTSVLFVPLFLKPGEYWARSVSFLNFFDRANEKAYRESQSALNADIHRKIAARPKDSNSEMVVAENDLISPFIKLFNERFMWEPGEYVISLSVTADPGSASYLKRYRFTLYESDTADLRKHADDYKYGGGISFNMDRHLGVNILLTEHVG